MISYEKFIRKIHKTNFVLKSISFVALLRNNKWIFSIISVKSDLFLYTKEVRLFYFRNISVC